MGGQRIIKGLSEGRRVGDDRRPPSRVLALITITGNTHDCKPSSLHDSRAHLQQTVAKIEANVAEIQQHLSHENEKAGTHIGDLRGLRETCAP